MPLPMIALPDGQVVADSSLAVSTDAAPRDTRDGAEPRAESRAYALSARASAGPGWGSVGVGGRVGLAGEYWLTDTLGLGLAGALLGQSDAVVLGPGTDSTAWLVTPAVTLRSARAGAYLFASLGAGYAAVQRTRRPGLCLDFGGGCAPTVSTVYGGLASTGSIGWLVHHRASGLEVGPVLEAAAVGSPSSAQPVDVLVTLNLAVGFAWRPSGR